MEFDYTYWEPFSPQEVAQVFSGFQSSWCIAGGWGLDLFTGRTSRKHDDIDLVLLRKDQHLVFQLFSGFEIFVVDPPGTLRPWIAEEYLHAPLYNIWIREKAKDPWRIQLMLQDHTEGEWLFRRDHSIRGQIEELIVHSKVGIPVLNPIIQLLYKAKDIRTKDQHDFREILPLLEAEHKQWLHSKITQVYGTQHIWLDALLIP